MFSRSSCDGYEKSWKINILLYNMDNLVQPLRQFVLHIRSKDVERTGELNSHIFIDLLEPITINPATEEIHQILLSGEIPYSFYNISSQVNNNIIRFTANGEPLPFTFPNKNYDVNELVKVMNDGNFPFTVSYDRFTMKLTFLNDTNFTNILNLSNSTANKVLGFAEGASDITVLSGQSITSTGIVDLATVHSIFVKSSSSSNMVFSTRAGFSTTIQKLSVDVNSGNIIYLNQNDSRQHTVLNSNIEAIELRLTDQNNNLIDLNDINYELTMGFFVYPINKTIQTRNLTGNMRTANIDTQQQSNMRPFTPQAQIRPQEEQQFINTEAPIEHKAKRLIIDDIIEQIQN